MQEIDAQKTGDDEWAVNCPNCDHEMIYGGCFDPTEPYTCEMCKTEFKAKRMWINDREYII